MSRDRRIYTRGLALLVASIFVPPMRGYSQEVFNTPINLNGDRMDCRAENLQWRPRWFAMKYHDQFHHEAFFRPFTHPIEELHTSETFKSHSEACPRFGLYNFDIFKSWIEGVPAFPTGHEFRIIRGD